MRILTVVDYDEMWPTLFENERTLLQMTLGKVISRIHHIGSTSVPGLSAKPVIDILIEVANLEELDSLNQAMEGVGYTVRGENGILNRRYFTKGGNQRSHHIHAFATGDAQIIKHLAFRDYLIKHNDVAIQYALMKKSAMLLCENDSHRYSIYKADFIQKHLRMALIASGRRARPAFARLIEQYRPQLEAYEGLCEDLGETPSDVALAWLLQNPVVTAPLIGPRTVEQLQQALHATTVTLSDDTMSCLDEIWPGPGGEAPQAYAW